MSRQVEVGAKFDFRQVGGSVAVFEIEQPLAGVDPSTNIFREVGEGRYRGVEATVTGEPVPGLRVLGGLTYLEPLFTRSINPAAIGRAVLGTPRLRIVGYGEYDVSAVRGLTVTGRITHLGDSDIDAANRVVMPSWTRLDIGLRQRFDIGSEAFTARLSVENVTNKRYYTGDTFGGFSFGDPQTYLASLTASF